jgi:arylsulfatase A-like enzyme
VTDATFDQILWTPLFIKLPHQQVGEVIDNPARSVDIVPTIDAVLNVKPPWKMDGHSLLGPARSDPSVPVVSGDIEGAAKVAHFDRAEGFARVLRS